MSLEDKLRKLIDSYRYLNVENLNRVQVSTVLNDLDELLNEAEPDGVNYYDSHEALVDLVQLWAEHEALNGGGPGWQKRFNAALDIAHELTRREP